jgi:hypothetical protein
VACFAGDSPATEMDRVHGLAKARPRLRVRGRVAFGGDLVRPPEELRLGLGLCGLRLGGRFRLWRCPRIRGAVTLPLARQASEKALPRRRYRASRASP